MSKQPLFWHVICLTALALLIACPVQADPAPGQDLLPVFRRASRGLPVRYVALGGSITQAGQGWIGDWLRAQFPRSAVSVTNAGMSATGSALGVFRLERDVIACQPDLVVLEFTVNDNGVADDEAVRSMESLVVRLKSLPDPPAVVILEVAADIPLDRARYARIARHYSLLDINLQPPVDAELIRTGLPWKSLFSDDVHPNAQGHALYGRLIGQALQPFADAARAAPDVPETVPPALPPPLSARQLLLDGAMIPLRAAPGWETENSLPFWWDMFFLGVASASEPGATLTVPFRGTTVGLFYAMDPGYGTFYASVDGGLPVQVRTNGRGGYDFQVFAHDLPPGEHRLSIVLPQPDMGPSPFVGVGPVKIGYVLVAGATAAPHRVAPQGLYSPTAIARLRFQSLPAHDWSWAGPFGTQTLTPTSSGPTTDMETVWPPEAPGAAIAWRPLTGDDAVIDLDRAAGSPRRGICYASTHITATRPGPRLLRLTLDYYAKLWVNGVRVRTIAAGHGGPRDPLLFPVILHAGTNDLLLKAHPGSLGWSFSLAVSDEDMAAAEDTNKGSGPSR